MGAGAVVPSGALADGHALRRPQVISRSEARESVTGLCSWEPGLCLPRGVSFCILEQGEKEGPIPIQPSALPAPLLSSRPFQSHLYAHQMCTSLQPALKGTGKPPCSSWGLALCRSPGLGLA